MDWEKYLKGFFFRKSRNYKRCFPRVLSVVVEVNVCHAIPLKAVGLIHGLDNDFMKYKQKIKTKNFGSLPLESPLNQPNLDRLTEKQLLFVKVDHFPLHFNSVSVSFHSQLVLVLVFTAHLKIIVWL